MWSEIKEAVSFALTQDEAKTRFKENSIHSIQAPIHTIEHLSLHFSGNPKCQSPLASKAVKPLWFSSHVNSAHNTVTGAEAIVSFQCVQHLGPSACARRLRLVYVTQKIINSRTATEKQVLSPLSPGLRHCRESNQGLHNWSIISSSYATIISNLLYQLLVRKLTGSSEQAIAEEVWEI